MYLWVVNICKSLRAYLSGWQTNKHTTASRTTQVWIRERNASEFLICIHNKSWMTYHIIVHTIIMVMNKKSNELTTICLQSLSLVSTWECLSCHPQIIIFDEKQVETGSFDLHLDSTRHNQIHIATTYNEHLRPSLFYLVHLIITSYKLCFVNWTPPFLSVLTSNVCISESESEYVLSQYKFTRKFVLRCTIGDR